MFVGMDLHKNYLQIAVMNEKGKVLENSRIYNSLKQVGKFFDNLDDEKTCIVMNGFELCEKMLAIDINVKVCFMSNGEINREALREIYPAISVGCFIRKPVTALLRD